MRQRVKHLLLLLPVGLLWVSAAIPADLVFNGRFAPISGRILPGAAHLLILCSSAQIQSSTAFLNSRETTGHSNWHVSSGWPPAGPSFARPRVFAIPMRPRSARPPLAVSLDAFPPRAPPFASLLDPQL